MYLAKKKSKPNRRLLQVVSNQSLDVGCPGKATVALFTDIIPRRPATEGRLLAALSAVEE